MGDKWSTIIITLFKIIIIITQSNQNNYIAFDSYVSVRFDI
jgi:hypothetical protein